MSASSLADLAVERDLAPSGQPLKSASQVLVAAIPSEALAAYTTLTGIVLSANLGTGYAPFRWSAYAVFVALAVAAPVAQYRHQVGQVRSTGHRSLPVQEGLATGLAAAAWGLVMPGTPLSTQMQGNALMLSTSSIALGTTVLLGLFTRTLSTANVRTVVPDDGTLDAARTIPAQHDPGNPDASAFPATPAAASPPSLAIPVQPGEPTELNQSSETGRPSGSGAALESGGRSEPGLPVEPTS